MPRTTFFAALAATLLTSGSALAQAFPSKSINLIYSTPPGGSYDPMTRVFAAHFEKRWGQPVVIESKPGAGSLVAAAYVARAPADGHTLLMSSSPLVTTIFIKDLPLDPFKDITGVSLFGLLPYQLQVSRGMNVKSLKEFVAHAKANPGKVTLGTVALGTHELEIHALQAVLGFNGNVIPFKGIGPIWLELIANRMDATLSASAPPQLKTGEIIAIAIGGDKRHPANPDIPTFREQGVAHDPVATFYMFASGATPRPILDRLSSEITALTKSPEFDARITKVLGVQGVGLSVDATRQFVHDEYTKLKKIADLAKIVPQ